jgi:2-polyprenyl-6-methoxyphenol hydroxylase-like FAD-dependent oxidoreductase
MWRSDSDHLCGMVPAVSHGDTQDSAFLRAAFGDCIPEWMREQLAEQLSTQDSCSLGAIVRCSALHVDGGVVLLGDSAHAVTSTLGQGCNMALESAVVLQQLLRQSIEQEELPLSDVPAAFTAARGKDVWAMQRMEYLSAVLQQGGAASLPAAVHARVALGSTLLVNTLQWKLQAKHTTLPVFRMLYDQQTPYSEVLAYINGMALRAYGVIAAVTVLVVASVQGAF